MENDGMPGDPALIPQSMLDCFATGDTADLEKFVGTDYYDHQSAGIPAPHGPRVFREVVAGARKWLPGLEVQVTSIELVRADIAEAHVLWRWTGESGYRLARGTVDRLRIAGGFAVEHWSEETFSNQPG